ncbi:hypothetical protein ACLOJK_023863 [Asimina triloba]
MVNDLLGSLGFGHALLDGYLLMTELIWAWLVAKDALADAWCCCCGRCCDVAGICRSWLAAGVCVEEDDCLDSVKVACRRRSSRIWRRRGLPSFCSDLIVRLELVGDGFHGWLVGEDGAPYYGAPWAACARSLYQWSTFRAPSSSRDGGCRRYHRRRHHRPPKLTPSPPHEPAVSTSPAIDRPPDAVNVAVEGKLSTVKPTTDKPPLFQSEPFITTVTASTFQIHRGRKGRKPTMITVATQGKSSSPVINKFIFIPLRSSPISDPNHTIIQSGFLEAMRGLDRKIQAIHHAGHRLPLPRPPLAIMDATHLCPCHSPSSLKPARELLHVDDTTLRGASPPPGRPYMGHDHRIRAIHHRPLLPHYPEGRTLLLACHRLSQRPRAAARSRPHEQPGLGRPHSLPPPARCQQCPPSMPNADFGRTLTCLHGRGKPPVSHSNNRRRMRIIRSRRNYSAPPAILLERRL